MGRSRMLLSTRSAPPADPSLDPCLTRAAPYSKLTPSNPRCTCLIVIRRVPPRR